MPEWVVAGEVIAVVVLLAVILPLLTVLVRRRWLASRRPIFDCAMRRLEPKASNWMLGLGQYAGDELRWFRLFSWSFLPSLVLDRRRHHLASTRASQSAEATTLMSGQRVVTLHSDRMTVELGVDPANVTALLSWLEAAPPGYYEQ